MQTEHIIALISKIRDKAHRVILHALKEQGISGIAPSHGDIFVALFTQGPLTMKQIAEVIHKDKSTVTALIDKLEDQGYLKRCGHASCGRTTVIELAPKGKALEPVFKEISERLLSKVYSGFSEKEKEVLIGHLERMNKNV
jgi:DNA-binding MarR family transcriptional regulator